MNTRIKIMQAVIILNALFGLWRIADGVKGYAEHIQNEAAITAEYECQMLLAERGELEPDEIAEICQP